MNGNSHIRQKILIADDSEMNRMMLIEMLGDKYDIIEVENGRQAIDTLGLQYGEISLLLLDLMMPEMDGFEVLAYMNRYGWIEDVPVIIISAESGLAYIQRGYDFGVTDFISRPFDAAIVRRRVENTLLLTAKQRRLTGLVMDQLYEKQKNSRLLINILSHIVEFRNGESGLHILHINVFVDLLLNQLAKKKKYDLTPEIIERISLASSLHDVGKIAIDGAILNKPGRLTPEEFEVIKTHTLVGAEMLASLPDDQKNDPLTKTAYEICRWHHEKYDGRGYPDGLKGDEIPISAQIVSIADVYDALTSERCYKKAYSHETALQMIRNGECGVFNPIIMECLEDMADTLKEQLQMKSPLRHDSASMARISEQLHEYDMSFPERQLHRLDFERKKSSILASFSDDILFTYTVSPPMLTVNENGVRRLGINGVQSVAEGDEYDISSLIPDASDGKIAEKLKSTTYDNPSFEAIITAELPEGRRRFNCKCSTIWSSSDDEKYCGIVGVLKDID